MDLNHLRVAIMTAILPRDGLVVYVLKRDRQLTVRLESAFVRTVTNISVHLIQSKKGKNDVKCSSHMLQKGYALILFQLRQEAAMHYNPPHTDELTDAPFADFRSVKKLSRRCLSFIPVTRAMSPSHAEFKGNAVVVFNIQMTLLSVAPRTWPPASRSSGAAPNWPPGLDSSSSPVNKYN
ncbi:hypothetical protein E2C01_020448 [Portunus trituberculatus]|uniref:Uncharacterized protein n=1 Tax=Portunus trituberculatus TaxID=210409 RepID=A0A5B7E055_PORTR|nr:hypothetical protein [Portunus trituberculatus]